MCEGGVRYVRRVGVEDVIHLHTRTNIQWGSNMQHVCPYTCSSALAYYSQNTSLSCNHCFFPRDELFTKHITFILSLFLPP